MSGRIRSIKPELLDDALASRLSDEAWRMWVSMWVLADDHGNTRADGNFLAARVWQDTSRDAARPLQELIDAGFVKPYAKEGQRYAHINGWEKHQRIDNAGKPRVPTSDKDDGTWDAQTSGLFAYARGGSPRAAASRAASPKQSNKQDQTVTVDSAASLGELPRVAASVVELPLARSGGETTISITDPDPEGEGPREESKADPEPPTSGPLPDGVVAVERTFWVESYKTGIAAGGGPAAYVFPEVKFKALRGVVEGLCTGEDRRNIPSWIQRLVTLYAKRKRALGWPPNTVDPWHPDALLAWTNSDDYAEQTRARSAPRLKTARPAPTEPPAPRMSPQEMAANAAKLAGMIRGFGTGG